VAHQVITCSDIDGLRRCLSQRPSTDSFDAAVAVIICCLAGPRIVLIERSLDPQDPWAGDMAFPGGHREPSDESPLDTALREAAEESCIKPKELEILGYLPTASPLRVKMRVVPVVARLRSSVCPVERLRSCSSSETRRLVLTPLPATIEKRPLLHRFRGKLVEGYKTWYGDIVWGMTLRIIEDLLRTIRECGEIL
jgi:8-oxo-dGTP diphosphatase